MATKKKNKKEKDNKKSKKKLIIIIVILSIIVLSLLGVIGFLVYRNSLENKTTGSDWSDIYYKFLKEQNKSKEANYPFNGKAEVSFVKIKNSDDPMMLVKSDRDCSDGKTKCEEYNIFGIEDDSVKFIQGDSAEKAEVKLFYNIEKKDYKYYLHLENENGFNYYFSLDTMKYDFDNYNIEKEAKKRGITDFDSQEFKDLYDEISKKKDSDTSRDVINLPVTEQKVEQKTLDGKVLEYNKIDELIVDTNVEPEYINYKKDMDVIKLRQEVVDEVDECKNIDDLLNKSIKKIVKEQIDLIEKVKQDIENAKNEIKADEEKKAKEAEAALYAKGLTVGSHNLKFGNYTTSNQIGPDGGQLYGTITLKPNGKFHIKTNFEQSSGETRNIDEDGTYTVGTAINSFDEQDAIKFTTNSGYRFTYFVTDNYMNSQWIIYKYSGN